MLRQSVFNVCRVYVCVRVGNCISAPIVHVPEKLQVELVDGVVDLLPVALHQLCVVHQLLLWRNKQKLGQNRLKNGRRIN